MILGKRCRTRSDGTNAGGTIGAGSSSILSGSSRRRQVTLIAG